MPASRELAVLCLLGYAASSFLLALATQSTQVAILSGLLDALLLAAISYALLLIWRLPQRWLQTTTALSGTGIIFSVAAMPLSYLLANTGNNNPLALLLFLSVIFLLVWNIAVMAHIMRHALSSSFAMGVLVAMFYVWVITATINNLFPPQSFS